MKDWLTIGQFSKKVGVSAKALRIYEKIGLLRSHSRGENGYRYYQVSQLPLAHRLKDFKDLGFTLNEIKELLRADTSLDDRKLHKAVAEKIESMKSQAEELGERQRQLERILTSLNNPTGRKFAQEREKYTMSLFDKVTIVVTGTEELEKTAEKIQAHLRHVEQETPIVVWDGASELPKQKPVILVLREDLLEKPAVRDLHSDVIVIRNLSSYSEEMLQRYLNLFQTSDAHLSTIINADDRASVRLAGEALVKKGAIYYFTKNAGYEKQIKNIGGIVASGDDITVYAFNRTAQRVELKLKTILAFDEEATLLSSLAAVMDLGIPVEKFERVI